MTDTTSTTKKDLPPAALKAIDFVFGFFPKLEGYKTYLIGSIMFVYGLFTHNAELILGGLGFITLRKGAKTEAEKQARKTGEAIISAAKQKPNDDTITTEELTAEPQA